jgi:hypothetical protein
MFDMRLAYVLEADASIISMRRISLARNAWGKASISASTSAPAVSTIHAIRPI